MISASGCILLARDTNRICLQLRGDYGSHGNTWGFWGGKGKKEERPVQTLLRELREEIGVLPDIEKIIPFSKFTSKDEHFEYNVFVVCVHEEFIPKLNHESAGYSWVASTKFPKPLHKGAHAILCSDRFQKKLNTIIDAYAPDNNVDFDWVSTLDRQ